MASILPMPFLRPPPLPPSLLFRRPTSISPPLCQKAATIALRAQTSPANTSPAHVDLADLPPLPYHVQRTASQKLPIYHLAKRGGNLHQTRIRKIQGDVERLREEIMASLALSDKNVAINRLTGHIIIKGWYKDDIKRFLEERHF